VPLDYRIIAAERRVLTAGSGKVTFPDAVALMRAMVADKAIDPAYSELVDLRSIQSIDLSAEQIAELAKTRIFAATSRRAIVAPVPLSFGMARMYEAHHISGGPATLRVFTGLKEALEWLDAESSAEPNPG
jgi:hypothetical protein